MKGPTGICGILFVREVCESLVPRVEDRLTKYRFNVKNTNINWRWWTESVIQLKRISYVILGLH